MLLFWSYRGLGSSLAYMHGGGFEFNLGFYLYSCFSFLSTSPWCCHCAHQMEASNSSATPQLFNSNIFCNNFHIWRAPLFLSTIDTLVIYLFCSFWVFSFGFWGFPLWTNAKTHWITVLVLCLEKRKRKKKKKEKGFFVWVCFGFCGGVCESLHLSSSSFFLISFAFFNCWLLLVYSACLFLILRFFFIFAFGPFSFPNMLFHVMVMIRCVAWCGDQPSS